jgi:hypothetical protein
MFTMLRLTFFDGDGFDYAFSLASSGQHWLFFTIMVYLCITSFGILNGLVGLFGSSFTVASEDTLGFQNNGGDNDDNNNDDDDDSINSTNSFNNHHNNVDNNNNNSGGVSNIKINDEKKIVEKNTIKKPFKNYLLINKKNSTRLMRNNHIKKQNVKKIDTIEEKKDDDVDLTNIDDNAGFYFIFK